MPVSTQRVANVALGSMESGCWYSLEERAKGCPVMTMAEAVSMGSEKLLAQGPTLLRNASVGWRLHGAISSGDGDVRTSS